MTSLSVYIKLSTNNSKIYMYGEKRIPIYELLCAVVHVSSFGNHGLSARSFTPQANYLTKPPGMIQLP